MRRAGWLPPLPPRPDPAIGPEQVGALDVVSSADPTNVDTAEVREMAAGMTAHADELRVAATALRGVGAPLTGDGRVQSTMPRPGETSAVADLAEIRASALAVGDAIDAIAARAEDLADGLVEWAAGVERADGEAADSFGHIVLDTLIGVTGTRGALDVFHIARAAFSIRFPATLSGSGPPLSAVVDDGVEALGRYAFLGTAVAGQVWPSLVAPTPPGTGSGEAAARAALPVVSLLRGGGAGTSVVGLDADGVPGLVAPGARTAAAAVVGGLAAAAGGVPGPLFRRSPIGGPGPALGGGSQVRTVADVIDRVDPLHAESGRTNRTHVEVLRTEHADGSTSFVVVVPGTNAEANIDPDNPMDNGSNVELAAGADAALLDGISDALEAAGAAPGDAVGMVGHSQGGLGIARWASSEAAEGYDLRASVTLSSPVAHSGAPVSGHHVAVETTGDLVTGLDGAANGHVEPGGAGSRSTYTVDTGDPSWYGQTHYPAHAAAAWDGVLEHRGDDLDVAAVQAEFASLLGAGEEGAVTESVVVEIERGP